jgi:hypothetical protein
MKLKFCEETQARGQDVIARFGNAALIRQTDGTWRLNGGSDEDRHSAREWISLFKHEAVLNHG